MSYYIAFEPGDVVTVEPPLTYAQIKDSPFNTGSGADAQREVRFVLDREKVETAEGVLDRVTASALELSYTEPDYNARNLLKHLQEVVDAFPEHTFRGRFQGRGERYEDLSGSWCATAGRCATTRAWSGLPNPRSRPVSPGSSRGGRPRRALLSGSFCVDLIAIVTTPDLEPPGSDVPDYDRRAPWWERAACRGMPLGLFYGPEREKAQAKTLREREAVAVCAGCPVIAPCLAQEMAFTACDQYGVFGGISEGARREMIRASTVVRPRRASLMRVQRPAGRRKGTGPPVTP